MILGLFLMICIVAVVIISIGTSIIRGILYFILGLFGFPKQHRQTYQPNHQSHSQSQQATSSGGKKREKVFDKTDGEYVDFEEIKE